MKLTDLLFYSLREWLARPAIFWVRAEARNLTEHLIRMEKRIMSKLDDLNATLDDISTSVDEQATTLAEQGKVQAEIALDVDDLLSLAAGGDLSAVVDKANALKDKVVASNAALAAATDALKAIAAKHQNPTEGQ